VFRKIDIKSESDEEPELGKRQFQKYSSKELK
jgi:hypothetical protein